ncbi:MAG: hypothetical protein WBE92_18035 [Steroidobacteraceae bacterium]
MTLSGQASFLVCAALLSGAALSASGANPCAGFRWDLGHEQALFATSAQAVTAGRDETSAPVIGPDRLYDLALTQQQDVRFVVHPEKRALTDGAYAGLARMHVPAAGLYRISIDKGFWIDVVAGHETLDSRDFAGRAGCGNPRKIVVYELPAGDLVLQLSGAISPRVRVTLTSVPPEKSSH